MIYKALTIAGSDTSGGAGIQADLKTFNNYGTYGTIALTCLVSMDYNNNWEHQVKVMDTETIERQIATNLEGIHPDALKTGMLPTVEIIELVAEKLRTIPNTPKVIDPVMACKGTEPLFPENAIAIREHLVPLATVLTPNRFEAAQLSGLPVVATMEDAKKAAIAIHALGAEFVVIKAVPTDDGLLAELLFDGKVFATFTHPQLEGKYTHGAGCTFAAAITAQLATGKPVRESIADASAYVFNAISHSEPINEYYGVLQPQ